MQKMETFRIHLWIGNEEVKTKTYAEVKDPGRLSEVVGEVAQGTEQHVDQAVRAAHQAFLSWRNTDLAERSALLNQAADLLQQEGPALANILSREAGMLISSYRGEAVRASNIIRSTVVNAQSFFAPKVVEDENSWVSVEKRPLGVIAAIIPWNVPLMLTMQKLAPILVTGNTIVIKPSPFASIGVSLILQKMSELFPPGVINVIHGDGQAGAALTTHPLVRKISFTGGGSTAKSVMKSAASSLKRVHFELGGNDPAIVLEDANLEVAMTKIATSAFMRSGQLCVAIKRVYIPEKLYDAACELVVAHANNYKIGYGLDENTTFGPVNNRGQYAYVKELVERAKNSSATVLELGTKLEPDNWNNGYYLNPTVVINPEQDQEIVTCEQFGPVLPLVKYRSEDEVIHLANNTEYGLGSSVWSSDFEHAVRVARRIEAGMTSINGSGLSALGHQHIPFGGVKQSGIGRENTEIGLSEFIEYHGINIHKS